MAYQETTTTGYGKRLGNSAKGIGTGILMLVAGTVLLWWNEGRAVKTYKMLKEAQEVAIHVDDISSVNPDLNGKLIHATATATTTDSLADATFNAGAVALRLIREVEYYQWTEESHSETRDKFGGGQETVTTYTYNKEWTARPINSSEFKDPDYQGRNFVLGSFEDKDIVAGNVSLGAYRMPESLVRMISGTQPLEPSIDEARLAGWDKAISQNLASIGRADTLRSGSYAHVNGNEIYFGINPGVPEIGDVRVRLTKILPSEVSVLAEVYQGSLQPFNAKNGESFCTLRMGAESMDNMFVQEHKTNKTKTWILRIGGLLLIYLGLKGIFEILVTLLKVIPFLAGIANLGISLVCGITAFVWALVVASLAWVFYRPVVGIGLLVVAGAVIAYFAFKGKKAV